jgi:two-component sensor histidine kinase
MTRYQDSERAAALFDLQILDTDAEQAFDDIVYIAAQTCDAPIALVSLLDGERQWFKARVGLDVCETPISQSVCKLEIDEPVLLQIPDLAEDSRTADNPLVTGPRAFRFYAGAPLVLRDGTVVGRLCVIDTQPRPDGLTRTQQDLLGALARQVSDQLELRRVARASEKLAALQEALVEVAEIVRRSSSVSVMTQEAAEVVGRVLSVDRAGFGLVDEGTQTIEVEPDWTAEGVTSIAGRHRFEDYGSIRDEIASGLPLVISDVDTDPRTADDPSLMRNVGIRALVNMPVREHDETVAVFIVNASMPRRWANEELAFLRSVADRLEAGVYRHRLDQHQETVNGEINHRLKNMLAMVQAIASQTLRGVVDREPIETFEKRLVALSGAHDILMQKGWIEADVGVVAEATFKPFGFADRVTVSGPKVQLGARAALSTALLFHELMTNACKYGALSVPTGGVLLDWEVLDEDDKNDLVVRWREVGGPTVTQPTRKGFGSRLIRLGLVGTGGVDVRYEPSGLQAEMRASIAHLATS